MYSFRLMFILGLLGSMVIHNVAQSHGQEISNIERYVLDRQNTDLSNLFVAGTNEFYYYQCLDLQHRRQLEQVDTLLLEWTAKFGRNREVIEIENRQSLLEFSKNPQESINYWVRTLDLRFDHQRKTPDAERKLPRELDNTLISPEVLLKAATDPFPNSTDGIEAGGLTLLASSPLLENRLNSLLTRITTPDFPNLIDLILLDMKQRDRKNFGDMGIHTLLTRQQMDLLAEKEPELLNQSEFVRQYLLRLAPDGDQDIRRDATVLRQSLEQMLAFSDRLAPVHNSLRASILFQLLVLDKKEGTKNRERFLRYLELPRNVGYIDSKYRSSFNNRTSEYVDFNQAYAGTLLETIGNDEPLVRYFLSLYLAESEDTSAFRKWIDNNYLERLFAEVNLLNGKGNPAEWSKVLGAEAMQQLTKRVDLSFSPDTPKVWQPGASIELKVKTKNIPQLVLNVFEINAENYYRQFGQEIGTELKLDGLVPTFQKVYQYEDNPLLQKERLFKLDSISKPGVYVVDLIGNGVNSRALIRIGQLNFFVTDTVAGQQFQVLDQDGKLLDNASIWFGEKQYTTSNGRLLVPYSETPGRRSIVVVAGDLASLGSFEHKSEQYQLNAGIYVDREALLQNRPAEVIVRPSLSVNGVLASPLLLNKAKVTLEVVDLDNVSKSIASETKINPDGDFVATFTVPERARSVQIHFQAEVKQISTQSSVPVSANKTFSINEIDTTEIIEEALLVPSSEGYFLEVRGKSGEPKVNRVVSLELKHHWFRDKVVVQLLTDEFGKVALGALNGIDQLWATPSQGRTAKWELDQRLQTELAIIHAVANRPIVVPLADSTLNNNFDDAEKRLSVDETELVVDRTEFALYQRRGEINAVDHFEKLALRPGRLWIDRLAAGNYQLHIKSSGQVIEIRVTDGQEEPGLIVGKNRILESQTQNRLTVTELSRIGDELQIQLEGVLPTTRVHVFATRFQPAFDAAVHLQTSGLRGPNMLVPGFPNSSYIEGRDIGEEMRYILDRQLATKYPGNMLPRPSLLLNPWSLKTTNNENQIAAGGQELRREQDLLEAAQRDSMSRGDSRSGGAGIDDFNSLDFLLQPAVTLTNLKPDEKGYLAIPLAKLNRLQHIRVVAVDHENIFATEISLAAQPLNTRDLRLADGLDDQKHFSQNKSAFVLEANGTYSVSQSEDPKVTVFASLADLFDYYRAKFPGNDFEKFEFLTNWSKLTIDEKKQKYSEFACHELHYYLFKRDRKFFDETVRPFLQNKYEKTFLDRWLLEEPLTSFDTVSQLKRLNTFERILLADRLQDRQSELLRSVIDQVAGIALDRQKLDAEFSEALNGLLQRNDISRFGFAGKSPDTKEALFFFDAAAAEPMNSPEEPSLGMMGGRGIVAMGRTGGGGGGAGFGNRAPAPGAAAMPEMLRKRMKADTAKDKIAAIELKSELQDRYLGERLAEKGLAMNGLSDESILVEREDLARRLYRSILPTQEWIESNYYRLNPDSELANQRCTPNLLWRDFAKYVSNGQKGKFLSQDFMHIGGDISELILALAILDLPETSLEHKVEQTDDDWSIEAKDAILILSQKLMPTEETPANSLVLVSENFFRIDDRYYTEDGNQYDKFVSEEFLTQIVYGSQVVITNPTSAPRQVELLMQIPNGSLPVAGTSKTKMIPMILGPFESKNFEYRFYFPKPGSFTHYPAHVSRGEKVLAAAGDLKFTVVDELTKRDTQSWPILSQEGTDQEVLTFLKEQNLNGLDLSQIAFRMKDKTFFESTIAILRQRGMFNTTLWSYGIQHSVKQPIAEFLLENQAFTDSLSNYFMSDWFQYDPTVRDGYQHREYWPLVNSRFHQLGQKRKLLNSAVYSQYSQLLDLLSHKPGLSADDKLALVYYLFLQDRIDEALKLFDQIPASEIRTEVQWDYLRAYVAMYRSQLDVANEIARQYLEHPVTRWRQRFRSIATQLSQIEGKPVDGLSDDELIENFDNEKLFGEHTDQSEVVSTVPTFEFRVDNQQVELDYRNMRSVTLSFYVIDLEQLFSQNPFSTQQNQSIGWVKPNLSQVHNLDETGTAKFDIPDQLRNRNLLIELRSGDQNKTISYFSQSMNVQIAESFGQLQVSNQEGKPLSKTYIKVYGKRGGEAVFLKDGYTDLRGRFDYVSQSNVSLDGIGEIAILISSENLGAQIKVVKPPQR